MDELYMIKNRAKDEECLRLPFAEYEELRNMIIQELLVFYERIDYADADWRSYELVTCGFIGNHLCMSVFNVEDWLEHLRTGSFDQEINKQLSWCIVQYARSISKLPVPERGRKVMPVKKTTVFRA